MPSLMPKIKWGHPTCFSLMPQNYWGCPKLFRWLLKLMGGDNSENCWEVFKIDCRRPEFIPWLRTVLEGVLNFFAEFSNWLCKSWNTWLCPQINAGCPDCISRFKTLIAEVSENHVSVPKFDRGGSEFFAVYSNWWQESLKLIRSF